MRLIRLYLAIALLRTSRLLMLAGGRIVEADQLRQANGLRPDPYRPVERMLLGSLVGVFIAGLWIWISARAGR